MLKRTLTIDCKKIYANVNMLEERFQFMNPVYLSINSESCGPYTLPELKILRRHGVVTDLTPIFNKEEDTWTPLKEVKELYAALEEKTHGEATQLLDQLKQVHTLLSHPEKLKAFDPEAVAKELQQILAKLPRFLVMPEYLTVDEISGWLKPVVEETKELSTGIQQESLRLLEGQKQLASHISSTDGLNSSLASQLKQEAEGRAKWLEETLLELDSRRLDGLRKLMEGMDLRLTGFEQRRVEAETEDQKSRKELLDSMIKAEDLQVQLKSRLREDVDSRTSWLTAALNQLETGRQHTSVEWRQAVEELLTEQFAEQSEKTVKLAENLAIAKRELHETLADKMSVVQLDLRAQSEIIETAQKNLADGIAVNQVKWVALWEQLSKKNQSQYEALELQAAQLKTEGSERAILLQGMLKDRFSVEDTTAKAQEERELKIESVQTTYFQFIGDYFEWVKHELTSATELRLQQAELQAKQSELQAVAQTKLEQLLDKRATESKNHKQEILKAFDQKQLEQHELRNSNQTALVSLLEKEGVERQSLGQKLSELTSSQHAEILRYMGESITDLRFQQEATRRADQAILVELHNNNASELKNFKQEFQDTAEQKYLANQEYFKNALATLQAQQNEARQADQMSLVQLFGKSKNDLLEFKKTVLVTMEQSQLDSQQQLEKLLANVQDQILRQLAQGVQGVQESLKQNDFNLSAVDANLRQFLQKQDAFESLLRDSQSQLTRILTADAERSQQIENMQSTLGDSNSSLVGRVDKWMDDEPTRQASAQGFLQLGLQEVRMGLHSGFAKQMPEQWSASLNDLGNKVHSIQQQLDSMIRELPLRLESSMVKQEKNLMADTESRFNDSSTALRGSMENLFSVLDTISKQVLDASERLAVLKNVTARVDGMEKQTTEMLSQVEQQRMEARMESAKSAVVISSKVRRQRSPRN